MHSPSVIVASPQYISSNDDRFFAAEASSVSLFVCTSGLPCLVGRQPQVIPALFQSLGSDSWFSATTSHRTEAIATSDSSTKFNGSVAPKTVGVEASTRVFGQTAYIPGAIVCGSLIVKAYPARFPRTSQDLCG